MSPPADRRDPDAEHRAQLRAVARRLHPDLGGDPDAYLAAVADLTTAGRATAGPTSGAPTSAGPTAPGSPTSPGPAPGTATSGLTGPVHRVRRRVRRGLRAAGRTARARLPRSVPGSRRWAQL